MGGIGRTIRVIMFLLLSAATLAFACWWAATHWRPSTEDFPIQGVDISSAHGAIEWPVVKANGADFAYVRATSGVWRDAAFERNWSGIAEAGMRRGAIHRFSLCRPATAQADAFVTLVPRVADALPAAVELAFDPSCPERPARDVAIREIRSLIDIIERHLGEPVLLKISPDFEEAYRVSAVIDRSLWAERPAFPPDYLARPWRIWQATTIRRVDGAEQPLNWDVVSP